jgi:hypothetical protein
MEGGYRGKYQDRDRFLAMFLFPGSTGPIVFYILFYKGKQINARAIISMQT